MNFLSEIKLGSNIRGDHLLYSKAPLIEFNISSTRYYLEVSGINIILKRRFYSSGILIRFYSSEIEYQFKIK